ncbi:c-type cytochrome [Aquabacterium sp.]|uniref:c-type cytochrome n=1 Tax=Aquabacterium sp. TaxID=1872578 RepID=UPI003D6D1487
MRVQRASIVVACCLAMMAACEREKRDFSPPQGPASAPKVRQVSVQAGQALGTAPPHAPALPSTPYTVEGNAYAVSQGKRLFRWFNCSGCHAPGGGGDWGPALSDDVWLYGAAPANIFASIVEGRPNGMPSFGGHIPEDQVWQLVAYVRSLSGQLRKDVAPGRADALQDSPPESARDREAPKPGHPNDGTQGP